MPDLRPPVIVSTPLVWRLRELGDRARRVREDRDTRSPRSGRDAEAAYAAAVEDVLRWIAGDAPATLELAAVLVPDAPTALPLGVGDRIQATAATRGFAVGALGTVTAVDPDDGTVLVAFDDSASGPSWQEPSTFRRARGGGR